MAQPVQVDGRYRTFVLLEHRYQCTVSAVHVPHSHLPIAATTHQLHTVLAHGYSRHAVVVTVVYGVQQPARFRRERPDAAVVPGADDLGAVV